MEKEMATHSSVSHCIIFLIVLYFLEILIAFMLDFFLFFFLKLHYPWILTLIFLILPLTPFVLCYKSEKKKIAFQITTIPFSSV